MGRNAAGVKGIHLGAGDRVIGLLRVEPEDDRDLLSLTSCGYGKRTQLSEYLVQLGDGQKRIQRRGGKGRRDMAVNDRNGVIVTLLGTRNDDDLMLISTRGMLVRINAGTIRRTGRGSQGVRVIKIDAPDVLASVARIADDEDAEENDASSE